MRIRTRNTGLLPMSVAVVCILAACEAFEPVDRDILVIQSFVEPGETLPEIIVRRTLPLNVPYPDNETTAVSDASVEMILDGSPVGYVAEPNVPGRYTAAVPAFSVGEHAPFSVHVRWQGQHARAEDIVPPVIRIDSVLVDYPLEPEPAVFADSLGLDLREGFLYPVEVTLWWTTTPDQAAADTLNWIRARLIPPEDFPSAVLDFFLRTEQILREGTIQEDGPGRRSWTGVYAVPVDDDLSPMPPHDLKLAILRGTESYARYISSTHVPERREPVSNVEGGVGIVAGLSVDRRTVRVGGDL